MEERLGEIRKGRRERIEKGSSVLHEKVHLMFILYTHI